MPSPYDPTIPPVPARDPGQGAHRVKVAKHSVKGMKANIKPILPPSPSPSPTPSPSPKPTPAPGPSTKPPSNVPPTPQPNGQPQQSFRQNVQSGMKAYRQNGGAQQGTAGFANARQTALTSAKGLLSGAIPSRVQKRLDRNSKRVSSLASPTPTPSTM